MPLDLDQPQPSTEPPLQPGQHRCPGPSTRDIILADGQATPPGLTEEAYQFLGDADLDYSRYTSPEIFRLENEKLWPKVWQWVCREEHLPEIGDYITYDVGPYSFLIAKRGEGDYAAYYNACLHRGTQLRPSESSGSTDSFRCPFHGWSWRLDGSLENIPCRWDFPHVTDERFRLPEVQTAVWGGFVFMNMDPAAPPLEDYLGVVARHFTGRWDLSRRAITIHIQKELPTNWKAAQEAFLEAYHSVETHSQSIPTVGDANAQYDVFGDTVTRFVHTIGYPSPHYKVRQTEQELFSKMRLPDAAPLPEGAKARPAAAQLMRESYGARWGVDLCEYTDSEMLDSIEYHLFPNMFLFPGISIPMIYRFRPLGMDHSKSLFDLVFLRLLAPGEAHPEPPAPVRIGVNESYADVPGMHKGLGFIYDQDTSNLEMQYRGFFASKKRGQTLGNYQEIRARHFHKILDRYLSL